MSLKGLRERMGHTGSLALGPPTNYMLVRYIAELLDEVSQLDQRLNQAEIKLAGLTSIQAFDFQTTHLGEPRLL